MFSKCIIRKEWIVSYPMFTVDAFLPGSSARCALKEVH